MTRITENQMVHNMIVTMQNNRKTVNKLAQQSSSGLKVAEAGDSTFSGTISELQTINNRLKTYENRINYIEGYFNTQDEILSTSLDLMTRAKEVATQAANETNSETERLALSAEIIQIRDELVSLANTKYQGQYIYAGTASDKPAYTTSTTAYTEGGEGTSTHYVYDGNDDVRTIQITDTLSIKMNSSGEDIFDSSITALEKLARVLQGYKTKVDPATGKITPDDAGNIAYVFHDEYQTQTQDILDCINMIDQAKDNDLSPEQVDVAGRQNRISAASSLLTLNKMSTSEALSNLQDADLVEVATEYSLAQEALSASLSVTTKMLSISILDYI